MMNAECRIKTSAGVFNSSFRIPNSSLIIQKVRPLTYSVLTTLQIYFYQNSLYTFTSKSKNLVRIMKHKNKIISVFLLITFTILSLSCAKQTATGGSAQTPTEAYKMLFAAVKAKDVEKIKQAMSKDTLGLAEFSGSQQKKPADEIIKNGFTATTFAESLPEIRDERVKDDMGAVEVYNQKDKIWEDLPFIKQDGSWKLAVGDTFKGTYKSPGKGQAQIEREASNTMMMDNTVIQMPSNTNSVFPAPPKSNKSAQVPPGSDGTKSIEVPKENKPKK